MPVFRIVTTGFKNPPVFVLDGRGPPKGRKWTIFSEIELRSAFVLYVLNGKAIRQEIS